MAHASGNPTWINYPTLTTPYTASTSEAQENAIDGLYTTLFGGTGRTTAQIIEAYYAGTTGSVSASTNTLVSGNWPSVRDTDSMYNYASGSIYMQAAVAGRFYLWGSFPWSGNSGVQVVYFQKNSNSATPTACVAYDNRPGPGSGVGGANKISEEVVLAAGDKLYLILYTSVANSVYGSAGALFGNLYCHFGMRWVAPS